MTNAKTALAIAAARIALLDEATLQEARAKGASARAHNRPRDGVLVPKAIAATPHLLAGFQAGWDYADAKIAEAATAEA